MGVQHAVDDQVGKVVAQRLVLGVGLVLQHRQADDDVGLHHRLVRVVKGQDVGGSVLAPVLMVELPAFLAADEAQHQLGVGFEGGLHPAAQLRAGGGQVSWVDRVVELDLE